MAAREAGRTLPARYLLLLMKTPLALHPVPPTHISYLLAGSWGKRARWLTVRAASLDSGTVKVQGSSPACQRCRECPAQGGGPLAKVSVDGFSEFFAL